MTALSASTELVTTAAEFRSRAALGPGLAPGPELGVELGVGLGSGVASTAGSGADFAGTFTFSTRTRVPSAKSARDGDNTVVSFGTLPMISTLRLPRIPTVTGTRSTLPLLTT